MTESTDPSAASDAADQQKLIADVTNTVQQAIEVLLGRVALALTEAKISAISLILVLVIGLSAVIILCATWGLASYALGYYLSTSLGLSMGKALLAVIGLNVLALLVLFISARSVISDISLSGTLDTAARSRDDEA